MELYQPPIRHHTHNLDMLLLEAPSREQDIDKHDSYLSLTNICKRLEASFLRTSDTAAEPNKRHSYHLCRQPCSSTRASKPAVDSTLSGQRVTGSTTRLVLGNPSQQSAPVRPRSSYISVRRRASDPAKPVSPCANTFLPTCIRATAASLELSSARDGKDSKSTRSSSGGTKSTGTDPANSNSGYAEDQKPDSRSIKDDDDDEEDDDSDDEEEDEDEDEEGDDGVVRCVCGERNDGELMIECEICQVWQHTLCMGIRDEAHIPDKYYCEKCRPEDHPYINSRPRTLVLAEASALGTTTMMRRSAVMAVAKMTAREEYRSAAAAAAIAASVAASASSSTGRSGSANGSGRKTPKKPGRKPEGAASSATPNQARKGKKSRRQGQRVDGSRNTGGDDPAAENSDSEYTRGSKGADASRFGAGMAYGDAYNSNGYEDDDDDNDDGSNGSRTSHSRAQRQGNGPRKTQTPKRSSVPGNTNGGKRRKVANQSPAISSRSGHSNSVDSGMRQSYAGEDDEIDGNESSGVDDPGFGDDPDAQYAQEDVVARMMGAKISDSTPRSNRSKTRTPKSRNRSISTIVKSNAGDSGRNGLAVGSPSRRPLKNEYSGDAAGKRRGKSAPGSPRLVSRSPSPSLQSLLYDDASNGGVAVEGHSGVNGPTKADRSAKRRRTGGGSNRGGVGKHSRMAVSATNSPYLGNGSVFGSFDEGLERQRGRAASNSATALADTKGKSADAGGAEFDAYGTNESEGAYDYGKVGATEYLANEDQHDDGSSSGNHQSSIHNRQPKHKFPPLETTDIDGNKVIIPSHLLNNHGLPMYSSADTETMCKIRYPHNKTSVFELNRRAKQLLEWLGKMQSEYEHEVNSLVEPLDAKNSTVSSEHEKAKSIEERLASSSAKRNNSSAIDRVGSHQVSEAPTSPIDPADWPDEEGYDGEGHGDAKDNDGDGAPKQPRSTLSIMEDLVWRLIRFQETYST